MITPSGARLRIVIPLMLATALAAVTASVALGAGTAACRVRNVTQDTSGRSLIRMVERAVDGDELRVRGTCRGEVIIDVDIVVRGVGKRPTLTGRDRDLVVRIREGAIVRLRGLTIERGEARNGGGIQNRGTLTLVESVVRRSSAEQGGGIYSSVNTLPAAELTLVRSTVSGNESRHWGGGGIYALGTLTIIRSRIVGNASRRHHTDGGGVQASGTVTIIGSRVSGNRAAGDGGGIWGARGLGRGLTITRSTVTGNRARRDGGGIWSGPGLTIIESTITDNVARRGDGGGANANGGSPSISGSTITGNVAGVQGGGIAGGGTISDTLVGRNSARFGGGIWGGGRLTGSIVRRNAAEASGGGIYVWPSFDLIDSKVLRNTADTGGGIFAFADATVTLDGTSSVSGNSPDDCFGTPAC